MAQAEGLCSSACRSEESKVELLETIDFRYFLLIIPIPDTSVLSSSLVMAGNIPGLCPIYLPGQEPLPPGATEADRAALADMARWSNYTHAAMESCPVKVVLSGGAGFALGGFFSLISASFAIDDPLRRSNLHAAAMARDPKLGPLPELTTGQQTKMFFKETGKSMYRSAKGFGKVGALYSGIECCIEAVS